MFFITKVKLSVWSINMLLSFNLLRLNIYIIHPDLLEDTHVIIPTLLRLNKYYSDPNSITKKSFIFNMFVNVIIIW